MFDYYLGVLHGGHPLSRLANTCPLSSHRHQVSPVNVRLAGSVFCPLVPVIASCDARSVRTKCFLTTTRCWNHLAMSGALDSWAQRNFTETQQSDHVLKSKPETKNGTPKRLRCGRSKVSQNLQLMTARWRQDSFVPVETGAEIYESGFVNLGGT